MNEGRGYDIKEALGALDPAALDYTEWLSVGMALKAEGYDLSVWEDWSRGDAARYHSGECARKWAGFTGTGVAGGTLLVLADTLARSVIAPQQLPVGVLTALIGVPAFLLLLARDARTK